LSVGPPDSNSAFECKPSRFKFRFRPMVLHGNSETQHPAQVSQLISSSSSGMCAEACVTIRHQLAEGSRPTPPLPKTSLSAKGWSYRYIYIYIYIYIQLYGETITIPLSTSSLHTIFHSDIVIVIRTSSGRCFRLDLECGIC